MKELKCPSGSTLKIYDIPFDPAFALRKVVVKEVRGVKIDSKTDMMSLFKDLFCMAVASDEIEKPLWDCLKYATYNNGKGDLKIDKSTFEAVEAREDFDFISVEVGKEAIVPFMKHLTQLFSQVLAMIGNVPA